jgi:HAD superfamily hydrolase (TIGR01509 family)
VAQAFDEADADGDWREKVVPIKGIQKFLSQLRKDGFHIAVATSDERKDTEAILQNLGMDGLFDIILCAGEVNPPKPHPQTLLTICHRLSISPQEAIFIGDTVSDMLMGKKAGVALTVGILEGGVTPREELEKVADIVVESIQELRFYKL